MNAYSRELFLAAYHHGWQYEFYIERPNTSEEWKRQGEEKPHILRCGLGYLFYKTASDALAAIVCDKEFGHP